MEKIMLDPKKFVAEVSDVDPTALAEIISLLEGLLTTSTNEEQDLQDKADEETAKAVQTAEVVLVTQAALEAAEQAHTAAVDAHDAQEIAKDIAVAEHADQSVGLDDEQQVLRDVIDMLNGLHNNGGTGGTGGACSNGADFVIGDGKGAGGTGGTNINLGNVGTIQECLDLITNYANTHPSKNVNGIRVLPGLTSDPPTVSQSSCNVELDMTYVNGNHNWVTCAFDFDVHA